MLCPLTTFIPIEQILSNLAEASDLKNHFCGNPRKARESNQQFALIRRNAVVWTHVFMDTHITRHYPWLRDLIDAWSSGEASTVAGDCPHSPALWEAGLGWVCSLGTASYAWEAKKIKSMSLMPAAGRAVRSKKNRLLIQIAWLAFHR